MAAARFDTCLAAAAACPGCPGPPPALLFLPPCSKRERVEVAVSDVALVAVLCGLRQVGGPAGGAPAVRRRRGRPSTTPCCSACTQHISSPALTLSPWLFRSPAPGLAAGRCSWRNRAHNPHVPACLPCAAGGDDGLGLAGQDLHRALPHRQLLAGHHHPAAAHAPRWGGAARGPAALEAEACSGGCPWRRRRPRHLTCDASCPAARAPPSCHLACMRRQRTPIQHPTLGGAAPPRSPPAELPHYTDDEWDWLRGALATVDRDYGWLLNSLHHHIADTHVAHHLFSSMPHYHAQVRARAHRHKCVQDTSVCVQDTSVCVCVCVCVCAHECCKGRGDGAAPASVPRIGGRVPHAEPPACGCPELEHRGCRGCRCWCWCCAVCAVCLQSAQLLLLAAGLQEATAALKPLLGDYYRSDSRPWFKALWQDHSMCRCGAARGRAAPWLGFRSLAVVLHRWCMCQRACIASCMAVPVPVPYCGAPHACSVRGWQQQYCGKL